jgi:hypothetical protein
MDPKVSRLWVDAFDAIDTIKTPTAGTKMGKSMGDPSDL